MSKKAGQDRFGQLVTHAEIIEWFKQAQCRGNLIPSKAEVNLLWRQVHILRGVADEIAAEEDGPNGRLLWHVFPEAKFDEMRKGVGELKRIVDDLVSYLPDNRTRFYPAPTIRSLQKSLALAEESFGRSHRGRKKELWRTHANFLRIPILEAWKDAGLKKKPSMTTPEGPFISVLCEALYITLGTRILPQTVSVGMRREIEIDKKKTN